jgi:hypothetical protein
MKSLLAAIALTLATVLVASAQGSVAFAQSTPPPAAVTEPVIKALQEALNKQGIAVKADGILNEQTRAAIRTYQSQHHLPVTGEPDAATLAKLGARVTETQAPVVTQAAPATPAQASAERAHGSSGGMMMNCPMMAGHAQASTQGHAQSSTQTPAQAPIQMQGQAQTPMQGQMHAMMQMMQGMMAMMQTMQSPMHGQQTQPGQMQHGHMQHGHMGSMHRGSAGGSHEHK